MVQQPCQDGYRPVMMVEREGEQTGLLQYRALEASALGRQAVQRGRADARIDGAERAPVLLIAGNEQNVGPGGFHDG